MTSSTRNTAVLSYQVPRPVRPNLTDGQYDNSKVFLLQAMGGPVKSRTRTPRVYMILIRAGIGRISKRDPCQGYILCSISIAVSPSQDC